MKRKARGSTTRESYHQPPCSIPSQIHQQPHFIVHPLPPEGPSHCGVRHGDFTLVGEHREGDCHQCHERKHSVDGVRILPLSPCHLEVCGHCRPIIACCVNWIGEHPENHLRGGETEDRSEGQKKGCAIVAHHKCVCRREDERSDNCDAEKRPPCIDLLYGHVLIW